MCILNHFLKGYSMLGWDTLRGRKKDLGNCCTRLKAEDNSFLGLLHTIGQGFDYCLII